MNGHYNCKNYYFNYEHTAPLVLHVFLQARTLHTHTQDAMMEWDRR